MSEYCHLFVTVPLLTGGQYIQSVTGLSCRSSIDKRLTDGLATILSE